LEKIVPPKERDFWQMLDRISILHYKTFKKRLIVIKRPFLDKVENQNLSSKNQLSGRVGRLKFLRAAIDRGFHSE
jgi:hypothetical protein